MGNQYRTPAWRHCSKRFFRWGHAGFTLLEVIVALSLLGILTAIFGMGLVAAVQTNEFSRTNVHIAQKAQLAMTRMSRELMELTKIVAESDQGNNPYIIYERMVQGSTKTKMHFGIQYHRDDSTIRLYTNLDENIDSLADNNEGDVLIDEVNSFTLKFYQGSDEWTHGDKIKPEEFQRLSTIELSMELARPDKPGKTQDFANRIYLRNNNNFGGNAPTTNPASRKSYNCFINSLLGNLMP